MFTLIAMSRLTRCHVCACTVLVNEKLGLLDEDVVYGDALEDPEPVQLTSGALASS